MKTLVETKDMPREEWLKYRNMGLGGSDCAAVLGMSPWKSPFSVWLDKTGRGKDLDPTYRMELGNKLEDFVAQEFMEQKGLKVRRRNAILQHDEHEFMLANVDRLIVGVDEGLECKVTNSFSGSEWTEEEIPIHYELQCHHYMAVTGFKAWWIAALIGNERLYIRRIERDEEIINFIIEKEKEFWETYVLADKEPAPDGSPDIDDYIKDRYPGQIDETIELDGVEESLVRRLEIDNLLKDLEKEKKAIDQTVKLAMGDFIRAEARGFSLTNKLVISNRVDGKKLEKEYPDIYKDVLKESSYKRFSIKED